MNAAEQPQDHPTLAKYPSHPTALYRGEAGVLWRVPLYRDRDEAVAVPVEDLVQARGAVHQLKLMVERGCGDDVDLEMMGHVLAGTRWPSRWPLAGPLPRAGRRPQWRTGGSR